MRRFAILLALQLSLPCLSASEIDLAAFQSTLDDSLGLTDVTGLSGLTPKITQRREYRLAVLQVAQPSLADKLDALQSDSAKASEVDAAIDEWLSANPEVSRLIDRQSSLFSMFSVNAGALIWTIPLAGVEAPNPELLLQCARNNVLNFFALSGKEGEAGSEYATAAAGAQVVFVPSKKEDDGDSGSSSTDDTTEGGTGSISIGEEILAEPVFQSGPTQCCPEPQCCPTPQCCPEPRRPTPQCCDMSNCSSSDDCGKECFIRRPRRCR